jgi:lysophospholipase L1-like esterase
MRTVSAGPLPCRRVTILTRLLASCALAGWALAGCANESATSPTDSGSTFSGAGGTAPSGVGTGGGATAGTSGIGGGAGVPAEIGGQTGGPAGAAGDAAGAPDTGGPQGGATGTGGGGAGAPDAGAGGTGGKASGGAVGGHAGGTGGAAGGHAGGTGGAAGGGPAGTLRIMPLGDSTTASICYRSHLWQMLTQAGHTQFNFIGTRNGNPGCSFSGYDKDHEGHAGYIVTDLLKATSTGRPGGADPNDPYTSSAADLATWFNGDPADIVIMHFGTNDVWNGIAPAKILQAYSAILAKLRTVNPNVRMMIAQITPMSPSGCSGCAAGVQALDAMIPAWATASSTATSPVSVVDQWTGFNSATDTVDGVHATDAGSVKIATNWFKALAPLF